MAKIRNRPSSTSCCKVSPFWCMIITWISVTISVMIAIVGCTILFNSVGIYIPFYLKVSLTPLLVCLPFIPCILALWYKKGGKCCCCCCMRNKRKSVFNINEEDLRPTLDNLYQFIPSKTDIGSIEQKALECLSSTKERFERETGIENELFLAGSVPERFSFPI